jgi:dephospho-CoA kinase
LFESQSEERQVQSQEAPLEPLASTADTSTSSSNQRLIALTGGIGSGKTQVSDYLESRGIPVADADQIVHRMLREDTDLLGLIRKQFGSSVFDANGVLDRKRLAAIIFPDPVARKILESWTHPRVRAGFQAFRLAHPQAPILVEVIPLLFESALETAYPEVWLVAAPEAEMLLRLQHKRGLTIEDARARMSSQLSLDEKKIRLQAHGHGRLLHNMGTLAELYNQVDTLISPP